MLRDLFVALILGVGVASLVRGPLFALLLYLWFAYFRPDQWLWFNWVTPIHLSLLIGVAAIVLTLLFLGQSRIRWRLETTLLALFAVLSVISTIKAQDPAWAYQSLSDFARVLLIGYLITIHGTNPKRLRLILMVIALSLGFEAAKQGWVNFILHPGGVNLNTDPVLGDNNGVAVGMFMLVPVVLALARTTAKRAERWMYWFLAGGLLLRGISTYSRGGLLGAGALAIMVMATTKRRVRALIVVGVVATAALSVMPTQFWNRMDTLMMPESQIGASAEGRLHFWHVAELMAADHPWTGIGFDGYQRAYDHWDDSYGEYGQGRAVHSAWFGILAEMGWPGLVLLVLILLRAFWNCRVVRLHAPPGDDGRWLQEFARALQTSLVVFAVSGSFLNLQYSEMLWHFICLTTAVSWTAKELLAHTSPAKVEAKASVGASLVPDPWTLGGPAWSWRDMPGFRVK